MASIISPLICGIRNISSHGFRSLPVLLSTTILVLGMAQGNINLIFFFVGLAMLSPLASFIVNVLWELLFSNTPKWATIPEHLWKVDAASAEACSLFTTTVSKLPETMTVVPSYWLTMMSFFFTYLFLNANNLYDKHKSCS